VDQRGAGTVDQRYRLRCGQRIVTPQRTDIPTTTNQVQGHSIHVQGLEKSLQEAGLHQVGSCLGYTGNQINGASRQPWPMRSSKTDHPSPNPDVGEPASR